MKEQYVGDISDYRKYALLRALGGEPLRLGVVWMLTTADGSSDGRKLSYLESLAEAQHDPELYEFLKSVASSGTGQRLQLVQSADILPKAIFHDRVVPDQPQERSRFFADASDAVRECDLVFFDPDNGLDVPSRPIGSKHSSKYVYRAELASTYQRGQSILVYQHFRRSERTSFARSLAEELMALCPASTAYTFATPHVLFVLVTHPKHRDVLTERIAGVSSKWPATFMKAVAHPVGEIDRSHEEVFKSAPEVSMPKKTQSQKPDHSKPSDRFIYREGDLQVVSVPTKDKSPEQALVETKSSPTPKKIYKQ